VLDFLNIATIHQCYYHENNFYKDIIMKAFYLSALLPLLLISGCNDAETQACRYYVQQDLDSANYLSAIDRIEDPNCQDTYPENDFLVDLGTAYLGKAGLTLLEVIRSVIDDTNDENNNQFSAFVGEVTNLSSDSAMVDLTNSQTAFTSYLDGMHCKDITSPSSTQNGICLLIGFVDILKVAMAIDAMTASDVSGWINNAEGNNPAMLRSTCALQYSYDHKNDSGFTVPYSKCSEGVSIEDTEFVTFIAQDNTTKDYNSLMVFYEGEAGYFMESEAAGSTVFTKNYCQTDYSACDDPSVSGCYACPINKGIGEFNIADFVVNSLNSGFAIIETIIENSGGEDSKELQESIDDFKSEIKIGGCELIPEGEDCFTIDEIISYLNKE